MFWFLQNHNRVFLAYSYSTPPYIFVCVLHERAWIKILLGKSELSDADSNHHRRCHANNHKINDSFVGGAEQWAHTRHFIVAINNLLLWVTVMWPYPLFHCLENLLATRLYETGQIAMAFFVPPPHLTDMSVTTSLRSIPTYANRTLLLSHTLIVDEQTRRRCVGLSQL